MSESKLKELQEKLLAQENQVRYITERQLVAGQDIYRVIGYNQKIIILTPVLRFSQATSNVEETIQELDNAR